MDSLQVCQLVVVGVHTDAEEETRISSVYDLGTATEFHKVRLIFLISGRDKTMDLWGGLVGHGSSAGVAGDMVATDLALEFHFLFIL